MNENLVDKNVSDFNEKFCTSIKHEANLIFQDNDSDSSILNLLDGELSDKTPEENISPYYAPEQINQDSMYHSNKPVKPNIKSGTIDQSFEERLLSKLPKITAIEKSSIQYQVFDKNYPRLSKSFYNCFNSPVLDLLVVVLNSDKLVSFYQGYFAGIPRLANELIDLNSKYWKSLISNNDENAWENHYKTVTDKFNSLEKNELEFEMGPVVRCRLKISNKHQFNQQFNYFFIQPCSYMIQLSQRNESDHGFTNDEGYLDINNVYMVSYINIIRECDIEYAQKGSAAASLQKVITNSTNSDRQKLDAVHEHLNNKLNNKRDSRTLNNEQLFVNIPPPAYTNSEKLRKNGPITYPLINEHQYSNTRTQLQNINQHRPSVNINSAQYMARGMSINIMDPNQHNYPSHYRNPQSTSTLQYILESRNPNYSSKQMQSGPLQMTSQHSQPYKNTGGPNVSCYLPLDHTQSTPSNCSLSSPTTFLPIRNLVPMSSNGIILSSDQYFRNSHQINVLDNAQVGQPVLNDVRSMSSGPNNYYCSTSQSQLPQSHVHAIYSIPHQNQFSASSLHQFCNDENKLIHMTAPPQYHVNRNTGKMSIKQESYNMSLNQKDWHANQMMDDSIDARYCDPLNPMTNDSISFDIVEEILKAEEAKSENKQYITSQSNSENSDLLSFDMDDYVLPDQGSNQLSSANIVTQSTSDTPLVSKYHNQNVDLPYTWQSLKHSDSFSDLKSKTLEKFTNAQRIGIKNLVNQHKNGELSRKQMLVQISDFVSHTIGKDKHHRRIVELWNTLHTTTDANLSNFNCSHIVQSPEEGPGISPTEQAAQSTTDIEDDKDLHRPVSKIVSKKNKEIHIGEVTRRQNKSKSIGKGLDASIYNITSTTSTGVLETLLNEHDIPVLSDKNYNRVNFKTRLSVSSVSKNQMSLDQLLMDDESSMLSGFNPSHDDKFSRKTTETPGRQLSSSNKSQPTTPVSGIMGVLETLLNQKNPSTSRIRQKSTESILNHSKPSRQNSVDILHEESANTIESTEKDHGIKKNSLLITLLNNSSGNSLSEKQNLMNSSNPVSVDANHSISQSKKQRMFIEQSSLSIDNSTANKKQVEMFGNNGMDIFDFVDCEQSCNTSEFQSGTVTSSQTVGNQKVPQGKRNRKRCYSKELSIDSDGSNDKVSISDKTTSTSLSKDKKMILTSLLETHKSEETIISTATADLLGVLNNSYGKFVQPINKGTNVYDDTLDFEDIKIDDFDLEHLIDMSEQLDDTSVNTSRTTDSSLQMVQDSTLFNGHFSVSSYEPHHNTLYSVVPPVINISQSDPIVQVSKQSILRVSDKNSILFSAIQSTSTMNTVTECLDNERERLLKQQQQQKVYMGGKYVSLNQLGTPDVDSLPTKISHTLSLDLLSKQMKEVGPNVMVEPSNHIEPIRPRKASFSKIPLAMSPLNTNFPCSVNLPTSPVGRLSSSTTSVSTDIQGENVKLLSSHVNHQQVREGLRLLVSNRSAQNISKNSAPNQRINTSTNVNELISPNLDSNITRSSVTKSMIHYHSETQIPDKQTEAAVSYPLSVLYPSPSCPSGTRITNILEDSLVNDVFGLEELINNKTSNPTLENLIYKNGTLPRSSSEVHFNDDSHSLSASSDLTSAQLRIPQANNGLHHHHHLQRYHHHHLHHHRHSVSQSNNEASVSLSKDKPSVNSTSGLLETLLSR